MSTIDETRDAICAALSNTVSLDQDNLLVFSDRKNRIIAVATSHHRANGLPATMVNAMMSVVSLGCDVLATTGPCWYSEKRRPLPLTLMTRARLESLRVWVDRRLEWDDAQLAFALGVEATELMRTWELWTVVIADEIKYRAANGEPLDPVLDAAFDMAASDDQLGYLDDRAWSSTSTEPLHIDCSPRKRPRSRSPSYTMHEAQCGRCGWATETGVRERTIQFARSHAETTLCGRADIAIAMVEYENGEVVSRIVAPQPEMPRWTGGSTPGMAASRPPPLPTETREERARALFAQIVGRDTPRAAAPAASTRDVLRGADGKPLGED